MKNELLNKVYNQVKLFKTKLDGDVKSEIRSILTMIYAEHKFEKLCIAGYAPWCDGEDSDHEVHFTNGWLDKEPYYPNPSTILHIYDVRDFFYDEETVDAIGDEELDFSTWVCPYEKLDIDKNVISWIDDLLVLLKKDGYLCFIEANGGDFDIKLVDFEDG